MQSSESRREGYANMTLSQDYQNSQQENASDPSGYEALAAKADAYKRASKPRPNQPLVSSTPIQEKNSVGSLRSHSSMSATPKSRGASRIVDPEALKMQEALKTPLTSDLLGLNDNLAASTTGSVYSNRTPLTEIKKSGAGGRSPHRHQRTDLDTSFGTDKWARKLRSSKRGRDLGMKNPVISDKASHYSAATTRTSCSKTSFGTVSTMISGGPPKTKKELEALEAKKPHRLDLGTWIKRSNASIQSNRITAVNKKITHVEEIPIRYCGVRRIYLGNNLLNSLEGFDQFPHLKSLSLANNNIDNFEAIHALLPCNALESLYLSGNPITTIPNYRYHVVGILTNLKGLDGTKVTDEERQRALETVRQETNMFELMLRNDILIEKLHQAIRRINTHTSLYDAAYGSRGMFNRQVPPDYFYSKTVMNINRFMHLIVFEEDSETKLEVMKKFKTKCMKKVNMLWNKKHRHLKNTNASSETLAETWEEAFAAYLSLQQSQIATLTRELAAEREKLVSHKTKIVKSCVRARPPKIGEWEAKQQAEKNTWYNSSSSPIRPAKKNDTDSKSADGNAQTDRKSAKKSLSFGKSSKKKAGAVRKGPPRNLHVSAALNPEESIIDFTGSPDGPKEGDVIVDPLAEAVDEARDDLDRVSVSMYKEDVERKEKESAERVEHLSQSMYTPDHSFMSPNDNNNSSISNQVRTPDYPMRGSVVSPDTFGVIAPDSPGPQPQSLPTQPHPHPSRYSSTNYGNQHVSKETLQELQAQLNMALSPNSKSKRGLLVQKARSKAKMSRDLASLKRKKKIQDNSTRSVDTSLIDEDQKLLGISFADTSPPSSAVSSGAVTRAGSRPISRRQSLDRKISHNRPDVPSRESSNPPSRPQSPRSRPAPEPESKAQDVEDLSEFRRVLSQFKRAATYDVSRHRKKREKKKKGKSKRIGKGRSNASTPRLLDESDTASVFGRTDFSKLKVNTSSSRRTSITSTVDESPLIRDRRLKPSAAQETKDIENNNQANSNNSSPIDNQTHIIAGLSQPRSETTSSHATTAATAEAVSETAHNPQDQKHANQGNQAQKESGASSESDHVNELASLLEIQLSDVHEPVDAADGRNHSEGGGSNFDDFHNNQSGDNQGHANRDGRQNNDRNSRSGNGNGAGNGGRDDEDDRKNNERRHRHRQRRKRRRRRDRDDDDDEDSSESSEDSSNSDSSDLSSNEAAYQEEIDALKRKLNARTMEVKQLANLTERYKERLEVFRNQNVENVKQAEAQIAQLHGHLETSEKNNFDLAGRLENAEEQISELNELLTDSQARNKELESRKDYLEAAFLGGISDEKSRQFFHQQAKQLRKEKEEAERILSVEQKRIADKTDIHNQVLSDLQRRLAQFLTGERRAENSRKRRFSMTSNISGYHSIYSDAASTFIAQGGDDMAPSVRSNKSSFDADADDPETKKAKEARAEQAAAKLVEDLAESRQLVAYYRQELTRKRPEDTDTNQDEKLIFNFQKCTDVYFKYAKKRMIRKWVLHVARNKLSRRNIAKRRAMNLRRSYGKWVGYMEVQKRVHVIERRHKLVVLKNAMKHWLRLKREIDQLKGMEAVADAQYASRCLQKRYYEWKHLYQVVSAERLAYEKELHARAVKHHKKVTWRRALQKWQVWLDRRDERTERMQIGAVHHATKWLNVWVGRIRRRRMRFELRQKAARFVAGKFFKRWQYRYTNKCICREKAGKMRQRTNYKLVQESFRRWILGVDLIRQENAQSVIAYQHRERKTYQKAIIAWKKALVIQKNASFQERLETIIHMKSLFRKWRKNARTLRLQRRKLHRALEFAARKFGIFFRKTFAEWRKFTLFKKSLLARSVSFTARRNRLSSYRIFSTWRSLFVRSQIDCLEVKAGELVHQIEDREEKIKELNDTNQSFVMELEDRHASIQRLKDQIQHKEQELETLKQQQTRYRTTEQSLLENMRKLESTKDELEHDVSVTKKMLRQKIDENTAERAQWMKQWQERSKKIRDYANTLRNNHALLSTIDMILDETTTVMVEAQFSSVENSKKWILSVTQRLRNMLQDHIREQEQNMIPLNGDNSPTKPPLLLNNSISDNSNYANNNYDSSLNNLSFRSDGKTTNDVSFSSFSNNNTYNNNNNNNNNNNDTNDLSLQLLGAPSTGDNFSMDNYHRNNVTAPVVGHGVPSSSSTNNSPTSILDRELVQVSAVEQQLRRRQRELDQKARDFELWVAQKRGRAPAGIASNQDDSSNNPGSMDHFDAAAQATNTSNGGVDSRSMDAMNSPGIPKGGRN